MPVGTALAPDTRDVGIRGERCGGCRLRLAWVPLAIDLDVAHAGVRLEDLVGTVPAVGVDTRACDTIDHQHLALAPGFINKELGPAAPHLDLIFVDKNDFLRINNIVEGYDHDAIGSGLIEDICLATRSIRVYDDRLGAF